MELRSKEFYLDLALLIQLRCASLPRKHDSDSCSMDGVPAALWVRALGYWDQFRPVSAFCDRIFPGTANIGVLLSSLCLDSEGRDRTGFNGHLDLILVNLLMR